MEAPPVIFGLRQVPVLLRGEPEAIAQSLERWEARNVLLYVAVILAGAGLYGAAMGWWRGPDQALYTAIKFPLVILLTTLGNSLLICLPSLYIFACLGGVQARLVEIAGLVAGLVALISVLLAGFAPVAWIFSQSTESIPAMGALHIAFGLVASFFGLRFLNAAFRHFRAQSRAGLGFWMVIFLLVGLQMTTALRPIVGQADTFFPTEKKFFIGHWADCLKSAGSTSPHRGTVSAQD